MEKNQPFLSIKPNIGLVQLYYGFGIDEFQRIVEMIKADALAIHVNPAQEVVQIEGDTCFKGVFSKMRGKRTVK